MTWTYVLLTIILLFVVACRSDRACYVGKGLEFRAPQFIVPCTNDTVSSCCMLGDICYSGNVCFSTAAGFYYQYGCTDVTYEDSSCPYKCGSDPAKSPWTGLQFCDDIKASDKWACNNPDSCGCSWPGNMGIVKIPDRKCQAMGSEAVLALSAPSSLLPLLQLPATAGASTGYYSPSLVGQLTIWPSTPQANYTPRVIAYATTYGSQVRTRSILLSDVAPSPSIQGTVFTPLGIPIYRASVVTQSQSAIVIGVTTTASLTEQTATSSTSAITTSSAAVSAPSTGSSGLSTGAIVGISVGGVVLTICLAILTLLIHRQRKSAARALQSSKKPRQGAWLSNVGRYLSRMHSRYAWMRVPAIMVLALVSGVLFAFGHHEHSAKLAGTEVSDNVIGIMSSRITSQQYNLAVGNGLAFLVKSSLSLAIGMAYTQAFWYSAKTSKLKNLAQIDSAYAALQNVLTLGNLPLWLRCPLLLCPVLMTWLVPLVAIFAPATLIVQNQQVWPPPTSLRNVSNLDLRSFAFSAPVAGVQDVVSGYQFTYDGPSLAVKRIAGAVAMQGNILPIPAPDINTTWSVAFDGPSLICESVSAAEKLRLMHIIANQTFADPQCFTPTVFQSWYSNDSAPSLNNASVPTYADPQAVNNNSISQNFMLEASFYLMTIPSLLQPSPKAPWNPAACESTDSDRSGWQTPLEKDNDTTAVLNCTLMETTYNVNFRLINGIQSVNFSTSGPRSISSLSNLGHFDGSAVPDEALRALSYQSIFQAFARLTAGDIRSGLSQQTPLLVNTSVLSTLLTQAKELAYLTPSQTTMKMQSVYRTDLQQILANLGQAYQGLAPTNVSGNDKPLSELILSLFHNVTISLMSSPDLKPDPTSRTYPTPVLVSRDVFKNVYVYSDSKLWLIYGLAIGLTTIAVGLGLICLYMNNMPYSSDFSTVMRVSRAADLSVEMQERDSSGGYPLPEYLAKAVLVFDDLRPVRTNTMQIIKGSERTETKPDTAALLPDNLPGSPKGEGKDRD